MLGPREFVDPALSGGLIELVPEYAGSALTFRSRGTVQPSADVAATHAALLDVLADTGVTALASARAQNTNTFVVTPETARRFDLDELSDLAAVATDLRFGGPPECELRPLCLAGLRQRYGLRFGQVITLDSGGVVTHQALRNGSVDVALLFTTDPELTGFVELADDRALQPAENVTPLVRRDVVDRWGRGVVDVIDGVSAALDTDTLRGAQRRRRRAARERRCRDRRRGLAAGGRIIVTTSRDPTIDDHADAPDTGTYVPPTARRTERRRRPTGAAPPLPRSIGSSGLGWLVLSAVLTVWIVVTLLSGSARRLTDEVDAAILRSIARLRTEWLSEVFRAVDRAATGWTMFAIAMLLLGAMVVFRRWRHLITFLASVLLLEVLGLLLIQWYSRPRPYDVTTIGRWQGYSLPSATVAVVSFTVVGWIYAIAVRGRPRAIAKGVGAGVVGLVAFARMYLGVDHPFDVLTGVAIGVAIPLLAFRYFTPNEIFPVTYRRGQDGPPRRRWSTGRGDPAGGRGAARRHRAGDEAGRTRRVGRVDAAAPADRR